VAGDSKTLAALHEVILFGDYLIRRLLTVRGDIFEVGAICLELRARLERSV
jgi:hypothetical protein